MDAGTSKQAQVEEQWRLRLARFDASGQTVAQFCKAESVSAWSFYRWRKQLAAPAEAGASPGFIDAGALPVKATVQAALPVAHATAAAARLEVRLDLGLGLVLHIVRS